MKTTIGGDRLGSGNKQEISLRNYNRSTHDLSYLWRSTMAAGTLVPFMSEVGLPGDSFDIDLNTEVLTLPTVGPLFGSYKVQLDVFTAPIRLYNGKLHMNMLGIGMGMKNIKLPQLDIDAIDVPNNTDDNEQINPSSLLSYLNIRGVGRTKNENDYIVRRQFNAIPTLAYWEIYANYYANKQEERGMVIHNDLEIKEDYAINYAVLSTNNQQYTVNILHEKAEVILAPNYPYELIVVLENGEGEPELDKITLLITGQDNTAITDIWEDFTVTKQSNGWIRIVGKNIKQDINLPSTQLEIEIEDEPIPSTAGTGIRPPKLEEFPLDNINDMRSDILTSVNQNAAFIINAKSKAPYGLMFQKDTRGDDQKPEKWIFAKQSSQEGLGIKTYQSDLFNNWISTEWIEGTNGINEITSVNTEEGNFTIDALNMANKVYNMLNRIAISGGSYDDWLDAVYTHDRAKSTESPVYHGSLIKELAFQEVISNADTEVNGENQPLGTLAGRGRLTQKNKGGKIKIKIDEPSYIMGIVSITPRIDYSQGNKWDTNLKTLDDFHKPALDEIGYQDLVTDQMAWFDTEIDIEGNITYRSAGKQPAWINYMTNVNQVRGNFAEQENQMFMVLNRRYERGENGIEDLTTYIDPTKFNHIFADTTLDAQNFWVQISNNITARRKMSAKVIPNL